MAIDPQTYFAPGTMLDHKQQSKTEAILEIFTKDNDGGKNLLSYV